MTAHCTGYTACSDPENKTKSYWKSTGMIFSDLLTTRGTPLESKTLRL